MDGDDLGRFAGRQMGRGFRADLAPVAEDQRIALRANPDRPPLVEDAADLLAAAFENAAGAHASSSIARGSRITNSVA